MKTSDPCYHVINSPSLSLLTWNIQSARMELTQFYSSGAEGLRPDNTYPARLSTRQVTAPRPWKLTLSAQLSAHWVSHTASAQPEAHPSLAKKAWRLSRSRGIEVDCISERSVDLTSCRGYSKHYLLPVIVKRATGFWNLTAPWSQCSPTQRSEGMEEGRGVVCGV